MATYAVELATEVMVTITVEADSKQEAEELAVSEFQGLTSYCGNGGADKLVGVDSHNMSLDPTCSWEVTGVEEEL
jgi:hypothetical protein